MTFCVDVDGENSSFKRTDIIDNSYHITTVC